jgi:hypothetical protein
LPGVLLPTTPLLLTNPQAVATPVASQELLVYACLLLRFSRRLRETSIPTRELLEQSVRRIT